jgi:hypothetical protein
MIVRAFFSILPELLVLCMLHPVNCSAFAELHRSLKSFRDATKKSSGFAPFPAVFVYQTVSGPARFYDPGGL